ncbi:MAG TPA: adenine phosphoribosyltransferase [Terrimicrobiaceae bacterium]|nr:adenine phosphoribosyltransferase [Terrimicrobiaceae bacterium]
MAGPDILREAIRDVPDFPKPGIVFKDITPILGDGRLFRLAIDRFVADCQDRNIEKIAGIDARGFLFGATVADRLGLGFVPIRKKGKLPWKTETLAYQLEYGEAEVEVHTDAFPHGERVSLIDDLLATGGTAAAAVKLIEKAGGQVVQAQFLIELSFLKGADRIAPVPVRSILVY